MTRHIFGMTYSTNEGRSYFSKDTSKRLSKLRVHQIPGIPGLIAYETHYFWKTSKLNFLQNKRTELLLKKDLLVENSQRNGATELQNDIARLAEFCKGGH